MMSVLQKEFNKSVVRLRNCMPEKFFSLCLMHLSVVLDLNDSGLEEILSDNKPKKPLTPLRKKKNESKSGLFGSQLTGESIASIFRLIEFLKHQENIECEGLFRKTGSNNRQSVLRSMLIQNNELNLESGKFSPHDCASVLKTFLKELPECLMMDKFSKAHIQLTEMARHCKLENNKKQAKVLKAIQLLILLLPKENTLLLECLLDLLSKVVTEKKNRMTTKSLGTIFAPHFLCPRNLSPSEFHVAAENFSELTTFIIEQAGDVFKIPKDLAKDVNQFWMDMENPNKSPENFFDITESTHPLTSRFAKANHTNLDSVSRSSKENLSIYQRVSQSIRSTGRQTRSRTFGLGESIMRHLPRMRNRQRDGESYFYGSNSVFKYNKGKNKETTPFAWSSVVNNLRREEVASCCLNSTYKPTFTDYSTKNTTESSCQTLDDTLIPEPPSSLLKKKLDFDTVLHSETGSPLVHVVDLHESSVTVKNTRKRKSDESEENKDKITETVPSIENEISYLANDIKKLRTKSSTPQCGIEELAFYTPMTSFRKNHYRTACKLPRRPMGICNTPVTESCV
uniref:Rho-GAP domain-containing protein n=2 Tax=Octopus bimaculoides TaxID=37653 RepID=A0A0L8I5E2_OCTBM|eukprot:XP_014790969.1 PREDICTED: rho GTPase-activating protein 19-like isoform X2 [Octopus bimaculoides]